MPGGISSLTYATTLRGTVDADRRVVVKVAPPGLEPVRNRDVLRQARVMAALGAAPGVLVPEVLVTDAGSPPFFVMAFVPGEAYEPKWDVSDAPPAAAMVRRPGARRGPDAGAAAGGGARGGRDRRRRAHPRRGDRALGGAVCHRRR